MARCAADDKCNEVTTVVLVGPTGHGKSATGNSIIGKKVFDVMPSSARVTTTTCELHSTVFEDGQILNVIDTPGLFDSTAGPELIGKDIAQCINMANNSIHAVLVVLSLRAQFRLDEEAAAVEKLQQIFGDHMIVVFAGGDALRKKVHLNNFLKHSRPEPLTRILEMCGNRYVIFDNITKRKAEKSEQLKKLLSLVKAVVDNNGGKSHSNELFVPLRKEESEVSDETSDTEISEFKEKLNKSCAEQLKRITEAVESSLRESTLRLEKQLAEEHAARLEAEAKAQAAQMTSNDLILKLMERLEMAHRKTLDELLKTRTEVETKLGNNQKDPGGHRKR